MQIEYDEKSRVFKLDTDKSSYLMGIVDHEGFPGHIYYGRRIPEGNVTYPLRLKEPPLAPSVNERDRSSFLDSFPWEYAGCHVGDYRECPLQIRNRKGHDALQPVYKGHRIYPGKPGIEGLPATFGDEKDSMTLELELEDRTAGVEIVLFYSVFADCEAIARSLRVKNVSREPLWLEKIMSLCLDMEDTGYDMLSLHGSWARERHMERRPLGHGKQSVGSVRGESSHQEHPFVALMGRGAGEEQGEVYGFHFVYSGNFLAQVEKSQFESLRVLMGIHPENFTFLLKPGESFAAPEVILTYSGEGLGGMTRSLHDLYRRHLIRSPYLHRHRPVLINNWEATYFDFTGDKLLEIAACAGRLGIELLVMDDGWFGNREDDNSSLGDWWVNTQKLGMELSVLAERVNKLGMEFGIWFEPEMISPSSRLYEEHPDWAIAIPGREACRSRNQYVLDLTNPQAEEYAYECVASILRSANIAYLKWDMNRQLTDLGSAWLAEDRQGELMHRYVLALYRMQERLLGEFPRLLLENCSGGGARFDPGMLYYSPQIWCSDNTDAIERLVIQEGTALLYPLSAVGAHVSAVPNHTVGRMTPFATRGHVALAGTFGYELDVTRLSEKEQEQIPEQIALYKRYESLIREGDYYRIASYRENHSYDCYSVVAKDGSEALITYVQVLARPNARRRCLRIRGLEADGDYLVEGTEGMEGVHKGSTLMNVGILMPGLWGDFQSALIYVKRI